MQQKNDFIDAFFILFAPSHASRGVPVVVVRVSVEPVGIAVNSHVSFCSFSVFFLEKTSNKKINKNNGQNSLLIVFTMYDH